MRSFLTATAMAGLVTATPTWSHVVLSQPEAPAGSYYTAYFRVGHGCDGAATTSLRVEIPPGIVVARPQPKPGWTVQIEHQPLDRPVAGEGGRVVTQRVSALVWSGGPLPDDQWDEFGLSTKLPDSQGPLYFPAVQSCGATQKRWSEVPIVGQHKRLTHPAPSVTLAAPRDQPEMTHMTME